MDLPQKPHPYETPEGLDMRCCDYVAFEPPTTEGADGLIRPQIAKSGKLIDFNAAQKDLEKQRRLKNYAEIASLADHLFPKLPREN